MDTASVTTRITCTVQHRRQVRTERVAMGILVGPALARQTIVRHVHSATVVASIAVVTVNYNAYLYLYFCFYEYVIVVGIPRV